LRKLSIFFIPLAVFWLSTERVEGAGYYNVKMLKKRRTTNNGSGPDSSNGMWTWIVGDTTATTTAPSATKGTASILATPGDRQYGVGWADSAGNLWMFGGSTTVPTAGRNDLWVYMVANSTWTWLTGNTTAGGAAAGTKGTAATTATPGAGNRAASWRQGTNLWLFGGSYGSNGTTNALWKYDTTNSTWTWVTGSTTLSAGATGAAGTQGTESTGATPPILSYTAFANDPKSNYLYLYGGGPTGGVGSVYDTFWRYNTSNSSWTWLAGAITTGAAGNWGTLGSYAAAVTPGARRAAYGWVDSAGNFWLYGGADSTGNPMDDTFVFDVTRGQWKWVKGSSISNELGSFGTLGAGAAANVPGARYASVAWTDGTYKFWLFGGNMSTQGALYKSDLWMFDPSTTNWTWVHGVQTTGNAGTYGTKGTANSTVNPGARWEGYCCGNAAMPDGGIWLFGGSNVSNSATVYGDLMRFK
jgi:hypothetical protein